MPVSEVRRAAAALLRGGADIANDVSEYGAEILNGGARVTTDVATKMVEMPADLVASIADILDPPDGDDENGD